MVGKAINHSAWRYIAALKTDLSIFPAMSLSNESIFFNSSSLQCAISDTSAMDWMHVTVSLILSISFN